MLHARKREKTTALKCVASVAVCLTLLLAFCLAISKSVTQLTTSITQPSNTSFRGFGTAEEPYEISSSSDLLELANIVNGGKEFESVYFKQMCDIDLAGIDWKPIGFKDTDDSISFLGYYDGNGYHISNLEIRSESNMAAAAFFGRIGGVIANLGIESGDIHGNVAGSIAAFSTGSNAKIANCYNRAEIHGEIVGGIAGSLSDTTIANCLNLGNCDGAQAYGVIGETDNVKVYSCFASTPIMPTSNQTSAGSATSHVLDSEQLLDSAVTTKLNIGALIARYLFLGDISINLLSWSIQGESIDLLPFGVVAHLIYIVNYWLLPLIVLMITCLLFRRRMTLGPEAFLTRYRSRIMIHSIALCVIALFSDAFLFANGECTHAGQLFFLALIHICSAAAIVYCIRTSRGMVIRAPYPIALLTVVAIIVLLELAQFGVVPRYDANIYYGSLIRGCQLFNYDLLSFIGAFCCWKWIQGLVLLVAPFEFLMPGQVTGIYLANVVITVITMACLYTLLLDLYDDLSPFCAALCTGIFCASPYILGMFTYFALDWHLAFFAVWLFYAVHKRNDALIVYCGFLLCFTKATGAVIYIFLLLSHTLIQCIYNARRNGSFIKSVVQWWSWKRVIFWILPAILFLLTLRYGDHFVAQEFAYAYTPPGYISLGDANQIINTSLHSFVFGFRWLIIVALIASAVIGYKRKALPSNTVNLLLAIIISFSATFCVLCAYEAYANCPRYTTVFAAAYAVLLPYAILTLLTSESMRRLCVTAIMSVFLLQTFFTLDPSIFLYCKSVPVGHTSLYRLAYNEDNRPGMNLHGDTDNTFTAICDLYAYNFEYNFYDSLLEESLRKIDVDPQLTIYSLNVSTYELGISGRYPYDILYNPTTKKRTYDRNDKSAQKLKTAELDLFSTGEEADLKKIEQLPNHFYLLVPYRAYDDVLIDAIEHAGYAVEKLAKADNLYGYMFMYEFKAE